MPEVPAAAAFWQRYLASVGEENSEDPADVACLGDSVELADELIELVLRGQKRATAGSLPEYEKVLLSLKSGTDGSPATAKGVPGW